MIHPIYNSAVFILRCARVGHGGSLKALLNPDGKAPVSRKPLPDFATLRNEMKKKGVTLQLLWEEYRSVHPDGYSRSRFCEL